MTSPCDPDGAAIPAGRRGLLKDLFYTRGNICLDIARLSSAFSVLGFWAGVGWHVWRGGAFDAVAVGTGCAAMMAGCAGWIFFRQQHERSFETRPDGRSSG